MFSLLLAFSIFIWVSFCDTGGTHATGNNDVPSTTQYYKEHQIRTDQLCPDLQESVAGRDIDTANYPYKSVFKMADQVWRTADPCVFESRGPRNLLTTLVIKAIQGEDQPWNYSGAQPCPEHIKLRIPNRRIFSRMGLPLCTVQKPPNPAKLFQGPYYNPHIWQLTRQKMGISFALYENETLGSKDDDEGGTEANEIGSNPNGFAINNNNAKLPKFVHIVFASFIGDSCSLRVQQYFVDPTRRQCNASMGRIYALCGMYSCLDEERVMKQAGFLMDDAMQLSEKYKLIDFLRSKQFRHPSQTSFLDFFINLMRLMIMPMVFFVAYYVTRQLREKLANRQLQTPARSASNLNIHTTVTGSRVGVSVILESPTSSRMARFEDPPPTYESLLTPPSYMEAITQKIQIISPSTPFPGGNSNNQIQQLEPPLQSSVTEFIPEEVSNNSSHDSVETNVEESNEITIPKTEEDTQEARVEINNDIINEIINQNPSQSFTPI